MKKSELFHKILDKVAEIAEVGKNNILNDCRLMAVVDARCLAVVYMRRVGLSFDDIALIVLRCAGKDHPPLREIKLKAKNIIYMYSQYLNKYEQSLAFREMSRDIDSFVKQLFE